MEADRGDRLEQVVHDLYRRTPAASADLRARILRGLDDHDAAARRVAIWTWWWRPAALRLAPAAVLAAACVLVAVGAVVGSVMLRRVGHAPSRDSTAMRSAPGSASQAAEAIENPGSMHTALARDVAFMLVAPGVTRVALVGEFNGWDPHATPLARVGRDGPWVTTVSLPPGRHVYSFILDDSQWMSDPGAPLAPDDGFGARNSVVVVGQEGPL